MDGNPQYQIAQNELPNLNHSLTKVEQKMDTDSLCSTKTLNINDLPQFTDYQNQIPYSVSNSKQTFKKEIVKSITEAPAKNMKGLENSDIFKSTDWMVGVIFVTFLLVIFTKAFFKDYFSSTIEAFFDEKAAKKLLSKRNSQRYRISYIITFVFAINISLFAVQVFNHFNITLLPVGNFPLFLIFFIAILFFYMSKRLMINMLGFVSKRQKILIEYSHNLSLHNKAVGLVLFPFLLSIPFVINTANNWVVVFGLVVVSGIYLVRLVRSLRIILSGQVSVLYTMLYIGMFEIAPLLVLFRAAQAVQSSELVAQLLAML